MDIQPGARRFIGELFDFRAIFFFCFLASNEMLFTDQSSRRMREDDENLFRAEKYVKDGVGVVDEPAHSMIPEANALKSLVIDAEFFLQNSLLGKFFHKSKFRL